MTAKNDDYFHLGLTDQEVLQSREKHGVNLLTPPKRPSLLKLYLENLKILLYGYYSLRLCSPLSSRLLRMNMLKPSVS